MLWALFTGVFTVPVYAGAIFVAWLLLRRITTSIIALALAVGVVVFVAITIPLTANIRKERALAALPADVTPPKRLRLGGDLRIEVIDIYNGRYRWGGNIRKYEGGYGKPETCGHFCRTLLAAPGVTSVTIDPPSDQPRNRPAVAAVTYRAASAGCAPPVDQSEEPISFATKAGLYDESDCVVGFPPVQQTDFRILSIRQENNRQPLIERIEVWNRKGKVLLRSARPMRTSFLTVPLMVEFTFDQHSGPFTIARTWKPEHLTLSAYEWYPANMLLQLSTVVARTQSRKQSSQ